MTELPLSLYVHIPFCRVKCSYCAFNIYTHHEHLIPSYIQALLTEIAWAAEHSQQAAHTLYIGGGTPSLLTPQQIETIVTAASRSFALSVGAEITLEANPGDISLPYLNDISSAGVNRLSIGVQSTDRAELAQMGRDHTIEKAGKAFEDARRAGFNNIGIDLIYGLPNQTLSQWQRSLQTVLSWGPDHLSLYCLSVEPRTLFSYRIAKGSLPSPDPDLAADMYFFARSELMGGPLEQYEISNWAVPGHESSHNLQYWFNRPYWGLGAGAHGYMDGKRYWNIKSISPYIRAIQRRLSEASDQTSLPPAHEDYEVIERATEMSETMILGLRLIRDGMQRHTFEKRFGISLDTYFGEPVARLLKLGLLEDNDNRLRLTPQAYLLSNQVFSALLI